MFKKIDTPSYIIDKKTLKRFSQRQTVFGRKLYDPKSDFYKVGMYDNSSNVISNKKIGYSRLDFVRMMGSWTIYDYFHDAFSWDKLTDANRVMDKPILKKVIIKDKVKISKEIKDTAIYFGAFRVGITHVNDYWIYSKDHVFQVPQDLHLSLMEC